MTQSHITRRKFLVGIAGVSVAGTVVAAAAMNRGLFGYRARRESDSSSGSVIDSSPVAKLTDSFQTEGEFTGEHFSRPHSILWDKSGYLAMHGGVQSASEDHGVVIIGGGIAGLTAAYELRDLNPVLLEQAPRFGGNSRAESLGESVYSLGAAYMNIPTPGGEVDHFLRDIGVSTKFRREAGAADQGAVIRGRKVVPSFWSGATDPARAREFKRFWQEMGEIYDRQFPEIPWRGGEGITREELDAWDRKTLATWVRERFGHVHPHIEEYLHEYSWSAFAAGYDEVSAAQAIGFISSDLHGIQAAPGGNAAISEAIHARLKAALPNGFLRPGSFVVDVERTDTGVRVCYEGADAKLRTITAKACVFAAPKFVARRVIKDLPEPQLEAMARMKYRGYVLANVVLKRRPAVMTYDLFKLTERIPTDARDDAWGRGFTDLVLAHWADPRSQGPAVLTLYCGLPFDSGRTELYAPSAYAAVRERLQRNLPHALEGLGLRADDIESLRLTRWGHAIPLAEAGRVADRTFERASAPLWERVFFAHNDNWANPCFETAFGAGVAAARLARRRVA